MDKFKLKCSWTENHSGEIIVEADNREEAIELLDMEQNRLLELLIEKYANETFQSLSKIVITEKEVEADSLIDVKIEDYEINYLEK
jgi:hypothetical protein